MSRRNRAKTDIGTKILIVICLMVFCGSGYVVADYFLQAHRAQKGFDTLKCLGDGDVKDGPEHLADLPALHKKNSDIVGWLKVPGTKIDYPVMQTKGKKPQYYLHRDFDRNYSAAGSLFMDVGSDISLPTSNWLIYGHHMRSGMMFHDLLKYREPKFFRKHPEFYLEVLADAGAGGRSAACGTGKETYQIIAACFSRVYPKGSDTFCYYRYAGITTKEEFDGYVRGVKALSAYDTRETAVYGDQLVTLSTCAYHTEEGRFFIVGKRIEKVKQSWKEAE